jgi:chromosome segregation ATPase
MRLGIEIEQINKQAPQELLGVKIAKGKLGTTVKYIESKVYRIRNHSDQDREVTLEHAVLPNWKLVGEGNPVEGTSDLYRFRLKLPPGRTAEQHVVEQSTPTFWNDLTSLTDEQLQAFRTSPTVSAAVKTALKEVAERRAQLAQLAGEEAAGNERLKAITDEQVRLRANIDKVPRESDAHKRYLEKFDKQETEIEQLQAKIRENRQRQQKLKKEYEDYLRGLSAE